MIPFGVKELAQITGGKNLSIVASQFHNIGTDTRVSLKGQAFFALKGDAFDAHAFLPQAVAQGAAVLVVHDEKLVTEKLKSQISVVLVSDTLIALQDLSQFYRKQMQAKVVGITGSNGKTTTKEFTAAIMEPYKKVHYNKGSFNNHWGVPFTLLAIEPQHEIAIVEMGMNHAGELTTLAKIATPDVVVVTTVGRAHMEAFGTLEKIAEAKNEIYSASPADSTRIYNLDNPECRKFFAEAKKLYPKAKIISFGQASEADVSLQLVSMDLRSLTLRGRIGAATHRVTVPVFGAQNVTNLMAACSLGLAIG
ncbi:MAG: UDP-N-acetylmuramoyl-tripeptide--D-alanyl-D-alanine ligase, partial [Pseudobdellovibrionaceae bacterium]